jgi:hypothetical protein
MLVIAMVPHIGRAQTNADTGVSITLAPTLVELGMAPGEIWRSNLKVINTNTFPLQLYVEPAHFAATGERGQGTVVPIRDIPEHESLLVHWIRAEEPSIVVPPGESRDIPFTVAVPDDASPGSHFAALQVSTVPPDVTNAAGLSTAQVISSLLFVRVAGDVTEAASVRSFTAEHSFGTEPSTQLSLRIQNDGNVHVQPERIHRDS